MDNQRTTFRMQFRFWLDIMRDEEHQIADYVEELKEKRSFASTIRDALQLIRDLRNGRVDVLLSLFPWIADHFNQTHQTTAIVPVDDPIREQLATLAEMMFQQGAQPIAEGQKPSTIAQLPPPELEDNDFELKITEATHNDDNRSDWNFMIAGAMQVHGNCDSLPDEIIAYGQRTGRIPKGAVTRRMQPINGPKPMAVPQFAPPDFEATDLPELELLE